VSEDQKRLPVVQNDHKEEAPSCSPTIYVSNEEAALLASMRGLREQSIELKEQLQTADSGQRPSLEREIEELRVQWKELAARREAAFIRKMIMLGHLPPGADADAQ
jgi:hypothetical protein